MPYSIRKTNRITGNTTYYRGESKWDSDFNNRKVYNTEDEANADNPSEFPGTATAE